MRVPLQRMAEQAERAGRVIKSVHDAVRRRHSEREAVHPQALLDAILPLINLQARKLQVRVDCGLDPQLPAVLCDRTMIEQVLLNLARNAMQAMAQPGMPLRELRIEVRPAPAAHPGPAWLEFSVADLGPGIAPDVADKLFTPFFTTKDEGMGLGLSLCRTVIEQHGGTLGFEARQPQGTIFRFTLPVCADAPAASP
jgi:two-component system sensor histidine kinase DctS